jgi:RNA polymerase sigma-70 factor (ECF subfamily)
LNNRVSEDIIARAQNGSPADAGELYMRHYLSIYRYLFYRTGDALTAEDLTAEVFLKMVRALPSYRSGIVPFQAWLFQIARNMSIDHHRRSQHYPLVELDENLDGGDPEMDRMVDFHLTSLDLVEGLKKIEESQRDVLVLRFVEGMAINETAIVLHKSIDAVKGLQRRGLQALKTLLNHLEVDHDRSK